MFSSHFGLLACLFGCSFLQLVSQEISDKRAQFVPLSATLSSILPWLKHASSRRSLRACERQDIPGQEHLIYRAAPDFPARPADSYPVHKLGRPPGGLWEEKCCRKRRVLQDASGVNDSSYLAVVRCGSGSGLLPALLGAHC